METNSQKIDLKFDQKLESIRIRVRQRLNSNRWTSGRQTTTGLNDTNGLFLEKFCFNSSQIREKHFLDSLVTGKTFLARVISQLDSNSFCLKPIETKNRFLNDLDLKTCLVVTSGSRDDIEVNDVVEAIVVRLIREPKTTIVVKVVDIVSDDRTETLTTERLTTTEQTFNNYIKSLNQFRNPFILRKNTFSSLLFESKEKRKTSQKTTQSTTPQTTTTQKTTKNENQKRREDKSVKSSTDSDDSSSSSSSSESSSSTTTTSTTSSSSSSESSRERRKRKNKKKKMKKIEKKSEKSSKKISFVLKKSSKSSSKPSLSSIPGFDDRDDRKRGSKSREEKTRRQLRRDSEMEQKIRLLAKTVQKD